MRPHPVLGLALAVLLSLGHSTPAAAQGAPDPGEPARIRASFMASRDPVMLLDLAASLRRLGRHAEAGLTYEEWKRDPRADPNRAVEVMRALADIDQYVGRLTISFDDPLARVWLDGREFPGFRSGSAVRVDPGDHQVSAARGALPPISQMVRLGAREARTVELRMGTYIPPGVPVVAPPMAPVGPTVVVNTTPPSERLDGPRVAATLLLVGGGLGLATGAAAGIAAITLELNSRSHCLGGGAACEQAGVDLQRQSRTAGSASTIAFGSGAALMLTGIILRAVNGRGTGGVPSSVRVGATGMEVVW